MVRRDNVKKGGGGEWDLGERERLSYSERNGVWEKMKREGKGRGVNPTIVSNIYFTKCSSKVY